MEHLNHETLEKSCGIEECKGHNQVLIMSIAGIKCHLPLIPLPWGGGCGSGYRPHAGLT